jgi:hypothetical protein
MLRKTMFRGARLALLLLLLRLAMARDMQQVSCRA